MFQLSALSNEDLLQAFAGLIAQDRRTTAALLAHIAEIDARHLYLREGHASMTSYCAARLGLSEDAAAKRIQVARLARRMPILFRAIAEGRLSLFAVRLLAPRLTPANVRDLIAEAAHRSGGEIGELLAHRFPQAEALRLDDGIAPLPVEMTTQVVSLQHSDAIPHAARHVDLPAPAVPQRLTTRISPISPERYALQLTLPKETHDKLRRLQELLGHAVPSGDVAQVLDRSFDALIEKLERRKFGSASARPARTGGARRTIPAQIKRAVYERDGGQCVGRLANGKRCRSRRQLEFDHILPLAKGGKTTIENIRLLCRAHNRAAAEEAFGLEFMAERSRPRGLRH